MDNINYYNFYGQKYYNDTVNIDMSNIYQLFLELLPNNAHILDLGCGSGRDTKYFLSQGYRVTAIDASEVMVKLSSDLTGQSTLHLSFDELNFKQEFAGIWACASLLHVPRKRMRNIINLLMNALVANGVIYLSFKYGMEERIEDDSYFSSHCHRRFFADYNEELLRDLFSVLSVTIDKIWLTNDPIRPIKWLNGLIRKN